MTQSTPDGYEDSGSIDHTDEETLRRLYWDEELSTAQIGELAGVHHTTILRQMQDNNIPRRDRSDAVSNSVSNEYANYLVNEHTGYVRWSSASGEAEDTLPVHRLLAVCEYGFEEVCGKHVHHKNGIPWDNRPDNIEIMEPATHHKLHGRDDSRETHKLTTDDVRKIKRELKSGSKTQKEIADEYGVTPSNVSCIKRGVSWSHITVDDRF